VTPIFQVLTEEKISHTDHTQHTQKSHTKTHRAHFHHVDFFWKKNWNNKIILYIFTFGINQFLSKN